MDNQKIKGTKVKKGIREEIQIPAGLNVEIKNKTITTKGQKGEIKRIFANKDIDMQVDGNKLILNSNKTSKKIKKMIGTFRAHILNMIKGASKGHKYVLKICSGHFPMNVSATKNQLIIKNFYGEKIPRVMEINEGINIKVEGDMIVVESNDKEKAGQCAASIERLTRRVKFDTRIFQDGIYIVSKSNNEIK